MDNTSEVTVTTERDSMMPPVPGAGKALLILMSGGRRGERAVLGDETFVIGRGSSADMQLESDAVSRQHAHIEKRGPLHVLIDDGSTNGSYVNYRRIKEKVLQDGDQIQIGESMLKYLSGDNIETAYHEEFRRLVRRDALTGALNHATYAEEVELALSRAERKGARMSLIVFDLDHFKDVNDTHGHTAGDLVLSRVGARVLEVISDPHIFARVGGEEFAVVVDGDLAVAVELAERIRAEIEGLFIEYEDVTLEVRTSLGVAEYSAGSAADLRAAADRKLYQAKQQGRNQVVF